MHAIRPGISMPSKSEIICRSAGICTEDIRDMSDEALLDMDYFLHENDFEDDDVGEEGFYIF